MFKNVILLILILVALNLITNCNYDTINNKLKIKKVTNNEMKNNTITLAFTGDVMLGRLVND